MLEYSALLVSVIQKQKNIGKWNKFKWVTWINSVTNTRGKGDKRYVVNKFDCIQVIDTTSRVSIASILRNLMFSKRIQRKLNIFFNFTKHSKMCLMSET